MRSAMFLLLVLSGCSSCEDATQSRAGASDAQIGDATKLDASKLDAAIIDANTAASFDDFPDGGSADLDLRAKHLLEAIASNDPSLGADIVLPREAYISARDAQDAAALYDSKFRTSITNHIARAHRHERGMENATFVSFDLGHDAARTPARHHEWNQPLWRATRSTLTYTIDGRVHRFEIAEMIAWRGHWYVARLH
jgi:hypothetical protein